VDPVVNIQQAPGRPASAEAPSADPHHARRWWILAVLGIAQLMVVLDATVVNIALPHAQAALGFSNADRQWVVTAYSLAFGSLLLLGGRIADLFGRKPVFLTGLAGFALASAVGGAAVNFPMLVTARAVQGAFGALLAPAALSLLTTTFTDPSERGKAFGVYGGIAGAGASIGLLLGGVLTEYLDWRWVMYVNVLFAAIALAGGLTLLKHRRTEHRPRLDLPGTLLVGAGLFSLVYGFSHAANQAGSKGWTEPVTLAFLAVGVVLLAAFVVTEYRSAHPLLPLRIVLDRNRGGAYVAMFLASVGMFGVFLFLTYYLETTLGYSAVRTGLAFLPMTGLIVITAAAGNTVLARRVSPKLLIPAGLLAAGIGLALLTRIGLASHYTADVLPALLVLGLGLGLVFAPAFSLGTFGVDPADSGAASATLNVAQQIGGSIGTALLNTIAAAAASSYLTAHAGRAPLHLVMADAAVHSYATAFWVAAGVFALAALIVGPLLRSGVPDLSQSEKSALPA
jgi:EmrB/QacA subfamily drug resistance transporter